VLKELFQYTVITDQKVATISMLPIEMNLEEAERVTITKVYRAKYFHFKCLERYHSIDISMENPEIIFTRQIGENSVEEDLNINTKQLLDIVTLLQICVKY